MSRQSRYRWVRSAAAQWSTFTPKRADAITATIDEADGATASVVIGPLTYTAVDAGPTGNNITVTYLDTATAGAETVDVDGNDITVGIEAGVSTANQIKTAVNADVGAQALVVVTGASASAQNEVDETALTGGTTVYTLTTSDAYTVDSTTLKNAKGMFRKYLHDKGVF